MSTAVTITLPGRPVTTTIDADALPRYLLARGWRETVSRAGRTFDDGECYIVFFAFDLARSISEGIAALATIEQRHPLDVLADLLPPAEGPALQWAHMSDAARARPLATLDLAARAHRQSALIARTYGEAEAALSEEGQALECEAAAAVLRGAR